MSQMGIQFSLYTEDDGEQEKEGGGGQVQVQIPINRARP